MTDLQNPGGDLAANTWAANTKTGVASIAMAGYAGIALFVGGFGVWAATAPLSGAAIVSGVIAAAGNNNTIQHLEGGIIKAVHISEGELVSAGTPLFVMDGTRARANLNTYTKQWIGLRAHKARLEAQRDSALQLTFEESLVALAERLGLRFLLDEQVSEFNAGRSRHESEQEILRQRASAARLAISGYESQRTALERQLAVIGDEMARKLELLDKGLTNRSEYSALVRSQAGLVGQMGSIASEIEQARSRIAEAEEQLIRVAHERTEQALSSLNEKSIAIGGLEEQIATARDVINRLVVAAPVDGLIVKINHNTPGSIVGPGAPLAELLPTGSELIVEARLEPTDIDIVRRGQQVDLHFVALNARTTPKVPGVVTFVSPDRLRDKATNEDFFLARLRITDDLPAEIDRDQIYPGMPVDAMIATGDRTFFEYLAKPITDSLNRSFREE
jgi:HlyD family type I secretion membrane fusion protein